jgi:hypothetical protein
MVITANAMGKDLYLNILEMASGSDPSDTTSYIYQLATLIKNGSRDSNGQYYPPLNPNLKVYVETNYFLDSVELAKGTEMAFLRSSELAH